MIERTVSPGSESPTGRDAMARRSFVGPSPLESASAAPGASLAHRALIASLVAAGTGALAWYIGVLAPATEKQRPLDTAMHHARVALKDPGAQFRGLERVGPMVCGEVSSASRAGGAFQAFFVDVERQPLPAKMTLMDDYARDLCRAMREYYAGRR